MSADIQGHEALHHHHQHCNLRGQELWESRGGRPGFPVPNSPYGPCGRKATVEEEGERHRAPFVSLVRHAPDTKGVKKQ